MRGEDLERVSIDYFLEKLVKGKRRNGIVVGKECGS